MEGRRGDAEGTGRAVKAACNTRCSIRDSTEVNIYGTLSGSFVDAAVGNELLKSAERGVPCGKVAKVRRAVNPPLLPTVERKSTP